jgi:outer membrane protein assembly factor BamB
VRRIGGNATHLMELDWQGEVVWQYENQFMHHDFLRLANGNTLVPEFVQLPEDVARSVRGGYRERNLPPMLSDDFVESDASGKEVRRISLWKLLDPRRDPICPLERRLEWTHTNSLDVTAEGDIVFSCRNNSTVGIVDGKSGALSWKYGWPNVSHQHHASVLRNGNIQIFDNGMHRRGLPRSSIVEVNPKDGSIVWQYVANPEVQFLSAHISGAERLPGGNVLVCEGAPGRVFEVTPKGEVVWEWINPFCFNLPNGSLTSAIFRAHRYGLDSPALAGRELDPRRFGEVNRMYGLEDE